MVGQDVSVMGVDNIPMSAWGAYQLTTISQEVDKMIQKTIELMLEKMETPDAPSRVERIEGELIIRSSVRNLS